MSEYPPAPDASSEASLDPTADAARVIKEQRVVTDGRESTTQVEESTVVVPSAATIERRRYVRARRTVYTVVNILSVFIFIRFLLVLFGADPLNGFAAFIYGITYPFVLPFRDLFGPGREPQLGVNIFDAAYLVAIAIYYLFAWIGSKVAQLVYLRTRSEPTEARSALR
jgi:YggT family protein